MPLNVQVVPLNVTSLYIMLLSVMPIFVMSLNIMNIKEFLKSNQINIHIMRTSYDGMPLNMKTTDIDRLYAPESTRFH